MACFQFLFGSTFACGVTTPFINNAQLIIRSFEIYLCHATQVTVQEKNISLLQAAEGDRGPQGT